jgi:hypothetical protein
VNRLNAGFFLTTANFVEYGVSLPKLHIRPWGIQEPKFMGFLKIPGVEYGLHSDVSAYRLEKQRNCIRSRQAETGLNWGSLGIEARAVYSAGTGRNAGNRKIPDKPGNAAGPCADRHAAQGSAGERLEAG